MSLYLVVFNDSGEELDGWVFGHYSDFGVFRDTVARHVSDGEYPLLLNHSDCDGEWSVAELPDLKRELTALREVSGRLPPEEPQGSFEHTSDLRQTATSLLGCFHNVDGELAFDALIALCDLAIEHKRPILFQ